MSVDPKRHKKIMKKRAEKAAAQGKNAPAKKQSSGSESFDKAIDLMLKATPKK